MKFVQSILLENIHGLLSYYASQQSKSGFTNWILSSMINRSSHFCCLLSRFILCRFPLKLEWCNRLIINMQHDILRYLNYLCKLNIISSLVSGAFTRRAIIQHEIVLVRAFDHSLLASLMSLMATVVP